MENSHWLLFFFLKTNLYFTNYMYMPSGHTCQSGHYIHPFTWYQNIKCNVNTLFACIVLPENKILTLCLFIVSTNTLKCNSVANCQDNIFRNQPPDPAGVLFSFQLHSIFYKDQYLCRFNKLFKNCINNSCNVNIFAYDLKPLK